MPEISIIIPVYNVAGYIERCIQSIVVQQADSARYEIIAVNDGSTDDSLAELEKLAFTIPWLHVYSRENSGPGGARNLGMNKAKGRYLMFVDPDDWIEPGALAKLLEVSAGCQADIIGYDYCKVDEYGVTTPYDKLKRPYATVMSGGEYLTRFTPAGVVWAYLFKRSFVEQFRLQMIERIFHQDEEFVSRAFCFASAVVFYPIQVYLYYKRADSAVNTPDMLHRQRLMRDMLCVVKSLHSLFQENNDETVSRGLERKLNYLTLDIIRLLVREGHDPHFINTTINQLRELTLFPLQNKPYGWKYSLFRHLVTSPSQLAWYARYVPGIPYSSIIF